MTSSSDTKRLKFLLNNAGIDLLSIKNALKRADSMAQNIEQCNLPIVSNYRMITDSINIDESRIKTIINKSAIRRGKLSPRAEFLQERLFVEKLFWLSLLASYVNDYVDQNKIVGNVEG